MVEDSEKESQVPEHILTENAQGIYRISSYAHLSFGNSKYLHVEKYFLLSLPTSRFHWYRQASFTGFAVTPAPLPWETYGNPIRRHFVPAILGTKESLSVISQETPSGYLRNGFQFHISDLRLEKISF